MKTHGFHVLQNANLCPHKQFKIDHSNCYMVEYVYILYAAPVPFLGGPYAEKFHPKTYRLPPGSPLPGRRAGGCADMPASSSEESSLPTIWWAAMSYPPLTYNCRGTGAPTGIRCGACQRGIPAHGYRAEFTIIDWERRPSCWKPATLTACGAALPSTDERMTTAGPALHGQPPGGGRNARQRY